MSENTAPTLPVADPGDTADVCLVLEGSYPYTKGGVGEWTHLLVQRMPELSFHLLCILPDPSFVKPVYSLPPNVQGVTNLFIFDNADLTGPQTGPADVWQAVRELHQPNLPVTQRAAILWERLVPAFRRLCHNGSLDAVVLSPEAYEVVLELYRQKGPTLPFLDYYYTFLLSHLPLLRLFATPVPKARLYHSISTGYAGMLAARAGREWRAPMLLTEHGIYTNERQIELLLATWIRTREVQRITIAPDTVSLKKVWMDMFQFLGMVAYQEAGQIYTIFEGNANFQKRLGADPKKVSVIPNGVDLAVYSGMQRRNDPENPLISLVGRVVAIKDIRTFIRACRVIADVFPRARFQVLGPTDAEEAYYLKCLQYRRQLGLEEVLTFTGSVKLTEYYPRMDVVALSSISEGLPLSVLEAMAVGIPVVSTKVGGCEDLLIGQTDEDRALGPAGIMVNVGDHRALGESIVRILKDPELAERLSATGPVRVRKYYELNQMIERYRGEYLRWIGREGA